VLLLDLRTEDKKRWGTLSTVATTARKTGDWRTTLPAKEEEGDRGGQKVPGAIYRRPLGDRRADQAWLGARRVVDTAAVATGVCGR
jgi:hypothetical protein